MIKLDPKWMDTPESLFQLSLETNSRRLRERFLALALIASGRSVKQVAAQVGRRRQTVAEWVEKYNALGVDGLKPEFKSKAVALLSDAEFEVLGQALYQSPQRFGLSSDKWRSFDVACFVKEKFNKEIHPETARRYIHRLDKKVI
ncbi:MAG: transposase [Candidatus Latescibacterota bacterium]|jgi:transposase